MEWVIETRRLAFRELTGADGSELARVLCDPDSMRYYPRPFSLDEVERWIERNVDRYRAEGFGLWAVTLRETGAFIGDCGITMQEIEGRRVPEIGYHIIPEFRRNGYASEAAEACVKCAFERLGLNSIVSYMKGDNIPSRRVAEKCGMTFVKYFDKLIAGETVREALYRIERGNAAV